MERSTPTEIANVTGALFICIAFLGIFNANGILPVLAAERPVSCVCRCVTVQACCPAGCSPYGWADLWLDLACAHACGAEPSSCQSHCPCLQVFYRERSSSMYSALPYGLALVSCVLPPTAAHCCALLLRGAPPLAHDTHNLLCASLMIGQAWRQYCTFQSKLQPLMSRYFFPAPQGFIELPYQIVQSALYSVITYWLIGFEPTAGKFF